MKSLVLFALILSFSNVLFSQFGEQIVISERLDSPKDIKVADLDNDGDLDVIIASTFDNKIVWYQNDGNGNFGKQHLITNNSIETSAVFATDINEDGNIDVISASEADNKIAWYENDGLGNFGNQEIISIQADGATSVHCSDLDNDGDMDVISSSKNDNKIAWYINDGNGEFSSEIVISTNASLAMSVYSSDLDGDGDLDVISASASDDKIAWYENDGFGDFGSQQIITYSANGAVSVFSEDLDGDGDMDILSASHSDYTIAWYENNGDGDFGIQQLISDDAIGASDVFSIDLDSDGDNDVLSTSDMDGKIAWYENNGSGVFGTQQIILGNFDGASSIIAFDIDGDSDIDVLSTAKYREKASWFPNNGTGVFYSEIEITKNENEARSVYSSDINGDGVSDIISASYEDGKISWYPNYGNGEFGPQRIISSATFRVNTIISSDLDGDGDQDILSASRGGNNGIIAWYENDGEGNFGPLLIISALVNGANCVYTSDLDNDGDLDVLSTSSTDEKIAFYENDGTESFWEQQIVSSDVDGVNSVYTSDLDADGDLDVLSSSNDNRISWFENEGSLTFGTEQIITTDAQGANSVFCADLDNDGDSDVLSSSSGDNKIAWYENNGNGNFGIQQIISTDLNQPDVVYSSDIDMDGNLDVLSISYYDNSIYWFRNLGNGVFMEAQNITNNAMGVQAIYPFDIDMDGDIDLLSASRNDDEISLYENTYNNGCTSPLACNYETYYTIDNGTCCYDDCGCTNENAENFDSSANCDDGSCILLGCTNPEACNFESLTNTDNGSCILPDGCTDPASINYNSTSVCDDGSCSYRINGHVFFDENENGIQEEGEYGLPFQEVQISSGITALTDDYGIFFFNNLSSGYYTLTLFSSETFPYSTTPNPVDIIINIGGPSEEPIFGLSNESLDFGICVDFYPNGFGYPCDDLVNHNICYRNMGNVPINGIVEVEYDSLFQGHIEITQVDSVIGNQVFMSFEILLPGEMFFYDILLHSPTADYLGEFLTSSAKVYGFYEGEQVAFGESILNQELTCSYDPNDKQVFPAGYEEPHYVLNETELEYLIRFQNTGNAPATNILVTDTLDDNLDLSTFMLMANSHSVMTSINSDTRVVEFYFENIMLPDSTNNEPESHGLVSFTISPYSGLEEQTEINNTGYIYFDNNPPIVTNTTWTTIFNCGSLIMDELEEFGICGEGEQSFEVNFEYVESYIWTLNGEEVGNEAEFTYYYEEGTYELIVLLNNPICAVENEFNFFVIAEPEAEITQDGLVLTASDGLSYQWLLNSEDIEGATNQTYTPTQDGNYSVEVFGELGCSAISSEIFVLKVHENTSSTIKLFPNPMTEVSHIFFEEDCSDCIVRLTASNGQLVREYKNITGNKLTIERNDLAVGTYVLQVISDGLSLKEFVLIIE